MEYFKEQTAKVVDVMSKFLGAKFRTLRESKNWTQAEAAEAIGISTTYYAHLERGEAWPSLQTIEGVKAAYNIDNEAFCGPSTSVAMEKLMTIIKEQETTIQAQGVTIRALQSMAANPSLRNLCDEISQLTDKSRVALEQFLETLSQLDEGNRVSRSKS